MLASLDPVIGVIIGLIIAPLGAYFLAARQFSGKIATSDASQLWEESRAIREWSGKRINVLESTVVRLESRLDDVEGTNAELTRENDRLAHEVSSLTAIIADLRGEIVGLTTELRLSRERIHQLEGGENGGV